MLGKCNYKCIILINSAIVNSALAIGSWRPHFDDESWRGSGYAFFWLSGPTVCLYSVLLCCFNDVLRPKKYSVSGQRTRHL